MNRIFIGLFLFVLSFSFLPVKAQNNFSEGVPIEFTETVYDFGTIEEGKVTEHIFSFKNTGSGSLILKDVVSTCECTVVAWSKEPIAAGGIGQITVTFNSEHKMGRQHKIITVIPEGSRIPIRIGVTANVTAKQ